MTCACTSNVTSKKCERHSVNVMTVVNSEHKMMTSRVAQCTLNKKTTMFLIYWIISVLQWIALIWLLIVRWDTTSFQAFWCFSLKTFALDPTKMNQHLYFGFLYIFSFDEHESTSHFVPSVLIACQPRNTSYKLLYVFLLCFTLMKEVALCWWHSWLKRFVGVRVEQRHNDNSHQH